MNENVMTLSGTKDRNRGGLCIHITGATERPLFA